MHSHMHIARRLGNSRKLASTYRHLQGYIGMTSCWRMGPWHSFATSTPRSTAIINGVKGARTYATWGLSQLHRRSPPSSQHEHSQQSTQQLPMSPQRQFRWSKQIADCKVPVVVTMFSDEVHDAVHRRRDMPSSPFAVSAVTLGQAPSHPDMPWTARRRAFWLHRKKTA